MHGETPPDAALLARGYTLVETHISRVYLSETQVYKFKRPVNLGFLDFTSIEARRTACDAEVKLNQRLAGDVYLGVVALVRSADGRLECRPAEQVDPGQALDWAVHMRRLDDTARADVRLQADALDAAEIDAIASLLARFHERAARDAQITSFGLPAQVRFNVEENFSQLTALPRPAVAQAELREIEAYQRAFLQLQATLLEQRAAQGFVRDGHGDLRLEHIYRSASGEHVVIDCIEFNQRFRYADVCADLAFLSMDLRVHARVDLAELLLQAYARHSGDYALYRLVDFYESYRALVRAKVSGLLANDAHVDETTRMRAAAAARRYALLALSAAHPPLRRPRLIVCMGQMASGKSTLARALGQELALPVLSADPTRKQLLGVEGRTPLHDAPFSGAYTAELSARVYATLRERAAHVLGSERSVILDATFSSRHERAEAAALAAQLGLEVSFLLCECDRDSSLARLARRATQPSESDGRVAIYDDVTSRFEPFAADEPGRHHVLNTNGPREETLRAALTLLAGC
jgi:aminoglycoside phosphotransferase family enzyme/predicted kinase